MSTPPSASRSSFTLLRRSRATCTAVAALVAVACSAADQSPLGGPHGGVVSQPVAANQTGTGASGSGSDDGGSSGADAGTGSTSAPAGCTAASAPATAPTFTQIYTKYFAPGAPVDCATGSGCHAEFKTETGAWGFLLEYDQVGTSPPELTDPNASWLTWYGGSMPESGTACNPQAMSDLNAWAAAGGQNN